MIVPGFWSDVVYTPTGFQFVVHQFGDPLPVAGLDESGREVWRFLTEDGMWYLRAAALADGTIAMVGQGHTISRTQCYIRHVDGRIQKVEIPDAFAWGQNGSLIRAESSDGWLLAFQTGPRTWRKVHLLREGGISYEATQPLPTWPGGDGSSSQGFLYWDATGEPVWSDPNRTVVAHGQPVTLSMVAENGVRVGQVPHTDGMLVIFPDGRNGVLEPKHAAFEPHVVSNGNRFAVSSRSLNGLTIIGVLSLDSQLPPIVVTPPTPPPPPPVEPPTPPTPEPKPTMKLSDAAKEVIVRFAAKFPLETTTEGSQAWTHKLCQQLKFSLPADGWGHKAASDTRPHSADCIAIAQPFIGWDVISGGGAPGATLALENDSIDLRGQTFEAVDAVDHLAATVRQTSSLDPAYLRAAIAASWRGMRGTDISENELVYWFAKASRPEEYSDRVTRIGWNAYWEARMAPDNTGSADPALGDKPARFLLGDATPIPHDEDPSVPAATNVDTEILAELQKHTAILSAMAAGLATLPAQLEASIGSLKASFDKGVKIRF